MSTGGRRSLARVALVGLASLSLLGAAPAKKKAVHHTKEEKVRHLLALTGAAEMGNRMLDSMIAEVAQRPDTPPGFAEKFRELAQKDDLVSRIVPVYMKYLDDRDLDAIIAFYDSAPGQHLAKSQPMIVQDSMAIGQKWGEELAQKTLDELKAEDDAKKSPANP